MSLLVELPKETYLAQRDDFTNFAVAANYDYRTARAMAWLSQLAYERRDSDKIEHTLGAWGLTLNTPLSNAIEGRLAITATRGIVASGWGATIIAYAGTDPMVPANWLTDFNTLPSPDDMHTGFAAAVKAVWPRVRSAILARDDAHKRLILTGHSLGGALAVITAKLIQDDELADIDGVYTFGMPRCGGARFVSAYGPRLEARTYRLVHGHDIVATVPPTKLGFRHVGQLLHCPHGGSFEGLQPVASSNEPEFADGLLDGLRERLRSIVEAELPPQRQPGWLGQFFRWLPPGIADHLPAQYLHALGSRIATS
jgi:triacylglycerol lipase